jgi:phytoene synthase
MDSTLSNAYNYCTLETKKSGSSFYYSFLFLSNDKKLAITSVYAFCREVDDIVDECSELHIAEQKLNFWKNELELIYNGKPSHPVAIALQHTVNRFQLPKLWFEEILQGMFMDLQYQGYQTLEDLDIYCHCVAGTVGKICASIFGYVHSQTLEYARELGIALQYINIIRDIGEDLRRNRVYLPEDFLKKYDISADNILQQQITNKAQWLSMMTDFSKLAYFHYNTAMSHLNIEDRQNQVCGIIMGEIYLKTLRKIKKKKFAVLKQKINITPINKLWTAYITLRNEQKIYEQRYSHK